ncbi:MAG TPA: glycosyltransferase family 4 protein, partial [Myxococcales bacterium]|nr:glycosyltransferase family 4 protein [Myxococcales bacterium]
MSAAPVKKVLLVGDFPPPHGGVATHVEELFHSARDRGAECEVLDIGKGQLPAQGVVPSGGMPRFSSLLIGFAARGFRVHVHTNGANPRSWMLAQACAAAGRLSGGALITLHSGLLPAWLGEIPSRGVMARAVLGQFAHVIAVSSPIRDALARCGVRNVDVVPAFSSEFVKPGLPPPGLDELRAAARPLYCAMIAPRPEYGAEILLDAFARVRSRLPAASLALYGPGSESVHADGVQGFGEIPRARALALMAACDVFVRPTLADGDSVSVREALALGRPVVATSVGHRPDGVRLVPPGDAAALAEALAAAAEAGALPAGPAANGLQRILSLYGLEAACVASAVS